MRTALRLSTILASWFVSLLVASCSSSPAAPHAHSARPVVELARWQVRSGDAFLGHVVHLEIGDPTGPVRFYRIQDLQGRWLGYATESGRFSRRVPFRDDQEDLGVWSLPRGTALLFEANPPVTLQAVPVEAAPPRPR